MRFLGRDLRAGHPLPDLNETFVFTKTAVLDSTESPWPSAQLLIACLGGKRRLKASQSRTR